MDAFTGYTPEFAKFFAQLEKNNERDWFNRNKKRYEEHVLAPTQALIRALAPRLAKISPHVVADDRKQGGSMMRIYRDTRFSKDKRPYNTNVSLRFVPAAAKGVSPPGFYLRLAKDEVTLGAGIYRPDPEALDGIRRCIDGKRREYVKLRDGKAFRTAFPEFGGDSLKRAPRGYDPEHPLVEDLKRKDHAVFGGLDPKLMLSKSFPAELVKRYRASAPFVKFLAAATGLPF